MTKQRFGAIEAELRTRFIERDEEIHGMLLATLSGQHIVFLGPPGNAKSLLIRKYSEYLGASLFSWLFTKFTTPDEVFGPVDIQAMKTGTFQRITKGKLPEAQVGFLDEIFKANSPILNSLLSILQERLFHNNGTPTPTPLIFCAGASNELPDEEEGLAALYDRFLLRYMTGYVSDDSAFRNLLALPDLPKTVPTITDEELQSAIKEVAALVLTVEAEESMTLVWNRLKEEGIINSDRRYKQLIKVMAAESWLNDETEIVADSLIVARHVLWTTPDQVRTVEQVVRTSVNPALSKAQDALSVAQEAVKELSEYDTPEAILQVVRQIRTVTADVRGSSSSPAVMKIVERLEQMNGDLTERMVTGATSE